MPPQFFPPSAVAFDLDETLYDRREAFHALISNWLPQLSAAEEMEIRTRDGGGYSPREEFFTWWAARWPVTGGGTGQELWARFRRELPGFIRPDPGAEALLTGLADAGVILGVLTNGAADWQREKLRRTGLAPFFPAARVLVSADLGFDKPDPRAFACLAEAMGLPAGRILYVGDHKVNDIAGGRRAGMLTCWLRRHQPGDACGDADLVIDSLAELGNLLRPIS